MVIGLRTRKPPGFKTSRLLAPVFINWRAPTKKNERDKEFQQPDQPFHGILIALV